MGDLSVAALLVLLVASCAAVAATGYEWREGEKAREEFGGGGGGEGKAGLFMLERSKQVVRTEAGEVRVVKGLGWRGRPSPMHIGFVSMEPNTLFLPQYMDASLILFVRRGDAKVGCIYKDELVERHLRIGDVYRIPAGSTFYIVNKVRGQRLQLICSIDTSESLEYGGLFQVSSEELSSVMKQGQGPILYMSGDATERAPPLKASQLQLKQGSTRTILEDGKQGDEEMSSAWTWRKLFNSIIWREDRSKQKAGQVRSPDSYNLYDRSPDFRNSYGWSVALDEPGYAPLKHSGVGVYLVNLTAGSMMAPHVNPTATEYGVVLSGAGTVQVVFPNGSLAMNAEVSEGDVFWVPRYFPFCQVASRSGPMEFFGFTTSARRNRPQFLVGASSILRTIMGPELAAAFGTSEEHLRSVAEAQGESVILPPWPRHDEGWRGRDFGAELPVTGEAAY